MEAQQDSNNSDNVILYFSISDPASPTLIVAWQCPCCMCISKEPLSVDVWLKSALPEHMVCENCNKSSTVVGFLTGTMPDAEEADAAEEDFSSKSSADAEPVEPV